MSVKIAYRRRFIVTTQSPKRVFVYFDKGVGPFSFKQTVEGLSRVLKGCSVEAICHQELANESWEKEAVLLAFPGGRDVPYHTLLRGKANAKIRAYVEGGGSYLGICAGAYYGAYAIEFRKGLSLEVCGTRELAFFPGVAVGPVYASDEFCYTSEKGARAASVQWIGPGPFKDRPYVLYYNGGCRFMAPERHSQVTVLAHYEDFPERPAAIVQCQVGKGRAILSGVHLEYPSSALNHEDPFLQSVIPSLREGESAREELWNHLVKLSLLS